MLFVSHDRYFVNRVADHLLIVEPDRFRVIEGNYDTYLHLVKQGLAQDARAAVAAKRRRAESTAARCQRTETEAAKRKFPYRKPAEYRGRYPPAGSPSAGVAARYLDEAILRDGGRVKQIQAELSELEWRSPGCTSTGRSAGNEPVRAVPGAVSSRQIDVSFSEVRHFHPTCPLIGR